MKLYDDVKALLPGLHGWCDLPKAVTLINMVLATRPAICVEFGVWGGRSLFPVAMALRQLRYGKVIAVDPWNVEASIEGQTTQADVEHWQNTNHEVVYQHFMSMVEKLELQDYIEVHRCKSEEIDLPEGIGLFHLDGNHGEQSFKEMKRVSPMVAPRGIVVLDDLSWSGGHVQRTSDWLLENGYIMLHYLGTGAAYLKI